MLRVTRELFLSLGLPGEESDFGVLPRAPVAWAVWRRTRSRGVAVHFRDFQPNPSTNNTAPACHRRPQWKKASCGCIWENFFTNTFACCILRRMTPRPARLSAFRTSSLCLTARPMKYYRAHGTNLRPPGVRKSTVHAVRVSGRVIHASAKCVHAIERLAAAQERCRLTLGGNIVRPIKAPTLSGPRRPL